MIDDQITDGRRIGELLAAEIHGRTDGYLDRLAIENADPDVTASTDGARAYDIVRRPGESSADTEDSTTVQENYIIIARVFISGTEAHLIFETGHEIAKFAARSVNLHVESPADERATPDTETPSGESQQSTVPNDRSIDPVTTVLLPNGAAIKRAVDVIQAVCRD